MAGPRKSRHMSNGANRASLPVHMVPAKFRCRVKGHSSGRSKLLEKRLSYMDLWQSLGMSAPKTSRKRKSAL
jgi:hypothetical protein